MPFSQQYNKQKQILETRSVDCYQKARTALKEDELLMLGMKRNKRATASKLRHIAEMLVQSANALDGIAKLEATPEVIAPLKVE